MKKIGRKEPNDHKSSNTSVSSRPSPVEAPTNIRPGGGKTHRWFSLRRVFQDIHGQRLSLGSKKKKSPPIEMEQASNVAGKTTPTKIDTSTSESVTNKKTKDGLRTSPLTLSSLETSTTINASSLLECPLCTLIQPVLNFPYLSATSCDHRSCKECLKQYLRIEITESRVNIACPECPELIHPNDIRHILDEDVKLYGKYEEFMLRRVLVSDPDARWCPAPDCNYVVIASGCASCPKLTCSRPGCGANFCYHCKQYWHPNQTCDAAKAERSSYIRSSFSQESNLQNEIKPCPRCQAFIIKMDDGSCNHMTCAICGAEFCWLCMKEISDLHYLSPSGCTFWGKKPWSRKKKILWQLGTLIGAPVGITLIAGIAVPAIIIGVPIWVGKRIYSKCSYMTVHKRNMATIGGVLSSILISPLLAAITVGIGVPILLAYVYGVVPISLCRSGGCGVRTTNTGGVKIDFNESETQPGNEASNCNATFAETRSVADGTHGVANPSIGPSIGEMSLVMTNSLSASGSHLDRVGAIREDSCDRDSASHRAMAGSCIAESLSGSLLGGNSGFQNRLEVQVELAGPSPRQDKRLSLTSESASIDTKSVTVSFGDNPNVKIADSSTLDVTRSTFFNTREPVCMPTTSDACRVNNSKNELGISGMCRVASSVMEGTSGGDAPDASNHTSVLRSSFQRCGSPPTSRSVSFKAADSSGSVSSVTVPIKEPHHHVHHHHHHHHHHGAPETGKYRHYNKKQSMSVGDSIDEERIEPAIISTFENYLSVHSLAARQASTDSRILQQAPLECCPGGSDIVAMVEAEQLTSATTGSPKLCHQHHYSACQNLDSRGSMDDYCRRFYVSSARISSSVQDAASSCDTISSCNTMSTSESNKDSTVGPSHVGNFSKINMEPATSTLESTCINMENVCHESEPSVVGSAPIYHQHHQRDTLKVSKYSSSHLAVMIEADGTDDDETSPIKCPSLVDSASDRSGGSCTSIPLFNQR